LARLICLNKARNSWAFTAGKTARLAVSGWSSAESTIQCQQPNCDRFCASKAFMRRALDGAAELAAVVSQERPVPALAKAGSERVEDAALGGIFSQSQAIA
jgi:hypothetical protein